MYLHQDKAHKIVQFEAKRKDLTILHVDSKGLPHTQRMYDVDEAVISIFIGSCSASIIRLLHHLVKHGAKRRCQGNPVREKRLCGPQ